MELGDIYLTTIAFTNFKTSIRKIDFREFWEVSKIFDYYVYFLQFYLHTYIHV